MKESKPDLMITAKELDGIVQGLQPKPCGMKAFDDRTDLDCPWIHRTIERHNETKRNLAVESVLLLQDWDVKPQSLKSAVSYLKECETTDSARKDNTIKNLFSSERQWGAKIQEGKVLVTNAAWGIRPGFTSGSCGKMCGYLGAPIHKRSFLTWGLLISRLLERSSNEKSFRLFVAGEWARFDNLNSDEEVELKTYMRMWCSWVVKNRGKVDEADVEPLLDLESHWNGKVIFLRHPCVWHTTTNFENDPSPE